jgi:dolichol-phosphate mannosyltransferase
MLKKLLQKKVVKFLIGGGVAALINLFLIFVLIEWLGFNTVTLRNLANIIAIELSLLASFFIYRIWVWTGGSWKLREVIFRQIPLYHLAAGTAVLARIFLIFPILNWLGVNYLINTLIGVLVSAAINYIISDTIVFKPRADSLTLEEQELTDIYYPEGLESSVIFSRPLHTDNSSRKIDLFSLVIPAHNEEGSIVHTIQSITSLLDQEKINYEILVVNDNSRDRTEQLLQQLSAENSRVRYLNNYFPNGFGFAVRCGLENFRGDAVAIIMADILQTFII